VTEQTPIRDRRPLPLQVYARLRARIIAGEDLPGARLPSEADLARSFGVSRVTVREALRLLQREGLLVARHGSGHFVLGRERIREPLTELRSVTELLHSLGYAVETTVLRTVEEAAGELASALELEPGELVVRAERLRSSGGDPLIYSIDVVPARLVPTRIDWSGSLVEALGRVGVELASSHATLRAATLPRQTARQIGLPPSTAWLLLEQVNLSHDGRPIIYSLDYHRSDRFEFQVVRQRIYG
jgi:GntR family transcriptional regulator